jgi:hypothetical protein
LHGVVSPGTLRHVERESIASVKLAVAAAFIAVCVVAVALLGAAA